MGLMSEAGCPGVADPGAVIVKAEKAFKLFLWLDPHLFLAMMASGMNGQSFTFMLLAY
jgi:16S rRNA (cytidine1402-2'-O)-methyltransferase